VSDGKDRRQGSKKTTAHPKEAKEDGCALKKGGGKKAKKGTSTIRRERKGGGEKRPHHLRLCQSKRKSAFMRRGPQTFASHRGGNSKEGGFSLYKTRRGFSFRWREEASPAYRGGVGMT